MTAAGTRRDFETEFPRRRSIAVTAGQGGEERGIEAGAAIPINSLEGCIT